MPDGVTSPYVGTITLDSDLSELERLHEFLEASCDRVSVPEEIRSHLEVALEELVVNAIRHGHCEPRQGAIHIDVRVENRNLRVAFSDNGIPFNPLTFPAPDLSKDLGHRPIGGLGIHLVRCLMPEIQYQRSGGRNCLVMASPIVPQPESIRGEGSTDADSFGNRPR